MDVVTRRVGVSARTVPFALSTFALLAGIVGVSALVRFLLALSHPTPLFFADEYIYSTLAHELATTGRPTIRGDAASFPALLEPILTAPFWLFGDAGVALRLTQALNAVAMSLAAVPVFLLARRLELARGFALAAAVLAVLVPDLFYVAYILAEPIAYPLVLGAIYVGVRALDRPTRWNQAGFVALAGLATFARIQFIVLPIAFVLAALVARTGLRRLKLTFGLFALAAIPVAAKGVGYYSGIADFHVDPGALAPLVRGRLDAPRLRRRLARRSRRARRPRAAPPGRRAGVRRADRLLRRGPLSRGRALRDERRPRAGRALPGALPLHADPVAPARVRPVPRTRRPRARGGRADRRGAGRRLGAVPARGLGGRPRAPGLAAADGRLPPLRRRGLRERVLPRRGGGGRARGLRRPRCLPAPGSPARHSR